MINYVNLKLFLILAINKNHICCLDFSVAKGGNVGGYRFDGESKLIENRLLKNY